MDRAALITPPTPEEILDKTNFAADLLYSVSAFFPRKKDEYQLKRHLS